MTQNHHELVGQTNLADRQETCKETKAKTVIIGQMKLFAGGQFSASLQVGKLPNLAAVKR